MVNKNANLFSLVAPAPSPVITRQSQSKINHRRGACATGRFASLLFLILTLPFLASCTNSETEYGSVGFSVEVAESSNKPGEADSGKRYSLDCDATGIATMGGDVLDSAGTTVATGGPWVCALKQGTIDNVPVGTNMSVTLTGKDSSGTAIYTGTVTGITVSAGMNTDAGTITITALDSTAPDAPVITSPVDAATIIDATPDVTGTAEAATTVELFEDTTSLGTGTTDADGAWTVTSSTLTDGAHILTAKATDSVGNTSSASTAVNITVDATAPTVADDDLSPLDAATGVAIDTAISATFSEAMATATVDDTSFTLAKTSDSAATVTGTVALTTDDTVATFTLSSNLANSTQYTATLTADITDVAGNAVTETTWSFTTVALPTVGALYSNGSNWMDYVMNSGSDTYTANNTTCPSGEPGGYSACIHGGEKRSVTVAGYSSCTNLTATDSLGAFDWTCKVISSQAYMISTGLKEGKFLSDLIDFNPSLGWKNNSVTVKESATTLFTTVSAVWWSNPISLANSGGTLSVSGTINVVTSNPAVQIILNADKVALVINPGLTITGTATGDNIISANGKHFLWIEGDINGTYGDNTGVTWTSVNFSVMRNLSAKNMQTNGVERSGIYLTGSRANHLSNVTVSNNTNYGVYLTNSTYNTLTNITSFNNLGYGVYLFTTANNNSLSNITSTNNSSYGIYLNTSSSNSLSNITTNNNGNFGIYLFASTKNYMSDITAFSNASAGIHLFSGSNDNSLVNVTAANNTQTGIFLESSTNNTILNATAVNNTTNGFHLSGATSNSIMNIAAAHQATNGVFLEASSSSNYFTGLLKTGSNANGCYVDAESTSGELADEAAAPSDGIHDGVCSPDFGTSNFTWSSTIDLTSSFIDKIPSDDGANTSDTTGGNPAIPASADWTNFDNRYRGWGLAGAAFPFTDHIGRVGAAGQAHIWDWSMTTGDTVIKDVYSVIPTGNEIITHTWSDASSTTFLRNSSEILGDDIGNENGLCETDETCLWTRNIGSYQGHGTLVSAGTFSNGTITGVTMMKYSTNGR